MKECGLNRGKKQTRMYLGCSCMDLWLVDRAACYLVAFSARMIDEFEAFSLIRPEHRQINQR